MSSDPKVDERRAKLSPIQYAVTQEARTEPPFTGAYWDHHGEGTYRCVVCDEPLFDSGTKFESGTGWPSFYDVVEKGNVATTLAIVYGERATAESALTRIGRRHGPVRGQAADGRAYRARDPRLMLWVQTTLVLTSVRWYEAVMGRMSDAERDAYWAEGKFFAGELGVPERRFQPAYADLGSY